MANNYFQFKQFTVQQGQTAMKVGVDGVMLGAWVGIDHVSRVLDVGTGTGLIALMLAQRMPMALVDAVEIDVMAYHQAVDNVRNSKWANRINVIHADYLQFSHTMEDKSKGGYDLIVSNPPFFVGSLQSPNQQRSTARHSESLPHGELINRSLAMLRAGGRLAVILPVIEAQQFSSEAQQKGLCCARRLLVQAHANKPIHRILLEWMREPSDCLEQTLCIEIDRHKYTEEYKQLTKDFYLK